MPSIDLTLPTTSWGIVGYGIGALVLFLASSVAFDVVHWLLHRLAASRIGPLRAIGDLHETHHAFLDRELRIHPEHQEANLRRHVIPEYGTQLSVSLVALAVLPAAMVVPVIGLQTLVFALIFRGRGLDINHREWESVAAYRPSFFCLPEYHALHHVYPEAHFSSWIKLLDQVLGTGAHLADRRYAVVGASGVFGESLVTRLREAGAASVDAVEPDALDALREVDVLVLAQDPTGASSAGSDRDAAVRVIERFGETTADERVAPEVWATCAPRADAAFEADARRYYRDGRFIYRHLVVEPGALDARAADQVLGGVRRGYNYVPAVPLGRALADFPRFLRTG